ncbi:peptidase M28 [Acidisarcina polymorpha]|uniref:Peptidase M28 n=1 Tax=Acidisarcina polymorpha TaxID=2211140 RepID=A0A2Z5FY41_9BACT|nr:M28 family peptidase [Acidisarcina polymorpha]AXC11387.1 peptidase M28 [Acidisarcina polymorpha]
MTTANPEPQDGRASGRKHEARVPRIGPAEILPSGLACSILATLLIALTTLATAQASHFNGARALEYARELVAFGPRYNASEGLVKAQAWLRKQFAKDDLVEDTFVVDTPAGPQQLHNFVVRFPGKKDGVIVLATHYETNYWLKDTSFVGANDGASTTGLLIEMASHLRATGGKPLDGYSVWLVFFDGEEAVKSWSSSDSLYGSRHLAAKWQNDGTLKKIKAFLLTDMIGDKDLDIARDGNSTPWLEDLVGKAAARQGDQRYFFHHNTAEDDDHIPFAQRGVPVADIIDDDYGPHDAGHPDGYHHTPQDTLDMISAKSLTIDGDVLLDALRALNQR